MKAGALVEQDFEDETCERPVKKSNSLPIWGNEKTMNLNPLILTNIQSSQYFKVNLYQLKTYHEVIDEIYYQVNHLEPWEKGSRKTSGQTGMCGGVRGVGAGGIVSTAFCILYKLYTLKLTRKQVLGLINHTDSPYIRGLGLMYVRFTQPPADLWEWFEPYLDDEEEIDVRAGGGQTSTIGAVVRHMLTKLEWHSTLFPRIPVPIQKDIEKKLGERVPPKPQGSESYSMGRDYSEKDKRREEPNGEYRYKERYERDDREKRDKDREEKHRDKEFRDHRSRDRDGRDHRSRDRDGRDHRSRDRDHREKQREDRHHNKERSRDQDKHREREKRSHERDRHHHHHHHHHHSSRSHHREGRSFSYEIEREKERIKKERRRSRSRSRSKDRSRRHRDY